MVFQWVSDARFQLSLPSSKHYIDWNVFKKLIEYPAYLFKFAIYLLFISFSFILYFSKVLDFQGENNMKGLYCILLLLYGSYRLLRTFQDFKAELRNEE